MSSGSGDGELTISLGPLREHLGDAAPDGVRWVLVDRLWPRGISREQMAGIDRDTDAAPSTELRRAYHHGQIDHEEFARRYDRELEESGADAALLDSVRRAGDHELVILVDAKDIEQSQGPVLVQRLRDLARA